MGFIWVEEKEDDQRFKDHIKGITEPLERSNEGLKADITKLKTKSKEFEGVNLDQLKADAKELVELKESIKNKETETEKALRIASEQHKRETESMKKELAILTESSKRALVDNVLMQSLVKNNVKSSLISAAQTIIKGKVSILEEGNERVAKVGDKTIEEYVSEWVKSEEGKHFVLAPKNSGGDASGSGEGEGGEGEFDKFFDKKSKSYNITQQVILKKKNPELYNKLLKKFDK